MILPATGKFLFNSIFPSTSDIYVSMYICGNSAVFVLLSYRCQRTNKMSNQPDMSGPKGAQIYCEYEYNKLTSALVASTLRKCCEADRLWRCVIDTVYKPRDMYTNKGVHSLCTKHIKFNATKTKRTHTLYIVLYIIFLCYENQ